MAETYVSPVPQFIRLLEAAPRMEDCRRFRNRLLTRGMLGGLATGVCCGLMSRDPNIGLGIAVMTDFTIASIALHVQDQLMQIENMIPKHQPGPILVPPESDFIQ